MKKLLLTAAMAVGLLAGCSETTTVHHVYHSPSHVVVHHVYHAPVVTHHVVVHHVTHVVVHHTSKH